MTIRLQALGVHLFTATGAVFAMLAMLAASETKWSLMFLWLIVAFGVDGIDGALARKYDVKKKYPELVNQASVTIINKAKQVLPSYATDI